MIRYLPPGDLPQGTDQRIMGGHNEATALPVPSQGRIFRAVVRDLRSVMTCPPYAGIIDVERMEGE